MSESKYWRTRFSRRAVLRAGTASAGLAAASALGLSCGDDDDKPSSATAPGTTAAGGSPAAGGPSPAASAAAAQPKRGGILPFNWSFGDGPHLDPHTITIFHMHHGGPGLAYSRLVRLKTDPSNPPPLQLEVIPDGAESWESPDETTYVFKMRKNIKYHNVAPLNGRAWKAQDLVTSWDRQRDKKITAASIAAIDKWTAIDDSTIRLTSAKPDADFLLALIHSHNKIDVAKEVIDQTKDDLTQGPVIGTGAWVFKEWKINEVCRLVRNPDYFLSGIPYADTWEMYHITDAATHLAALRTKKILARTTNTATDIKALKAESKDIQSFFAPTGVTFLFMPTDRPFTKDLRVRQALSKAMNRQDIIAGSDNEWDWSTPLLTPGAAYNLPLDEVKKLLALDVKGAKDLLAAVPGINTWKPEIIVQSTSPAAVAGTELVVQQLKQVGIEAKINPVDSNRISVDVLRATGGNFDLAFSGAPANVSMNAELNNRWKTGSAQNSFKLSDPQLDSMIDRQAVMVKDLAGRQALIKDIQRRMIELAAGAPVLASLAGYAWWGELKNYVGTGAGLPEYGQYMNMWRDA